jgi:hypothetical protein
MTQKSHFFVLLLICIRQVRLQLFLEPKCSFSKPLYAPMDPQPEFIVTKSTLSEARDERHPNCSPYSVCGLRDLDPRRQLNSFFVSTSGRQGQLQDLTTFNN